MAKNRKHYFKNTVNPTNTFKPMNTFKEKKDTVKNSMPKFSDGFLAGVEMRKQFTEAQIEYLKFKYFWAGAATGVGVFGLIYTFLNLYLKLS